MNAIGATSSAGRLTPLHPAAAPTPPSAAQAQGEFNTKALALIDIEAWRRAVDLARPNGVPANRPELSVTQLPAPAALQLERVAQQMGGGLALRADHAIFAGLCFLCWALLPSQPTDAQNLAGSFWRRCAVGAEVLFSLAAVGAGLPGPRAAAPRRRGPPTPPENF